MRAEPSGPRRPAFAGGSVVPGRPDAGVEYLNNHDDYRQCDPVLYGALASMVYSGRRNVLSVQNAGILPSDTVFHDTYLGGASDRSAYMQDALRTTKQCAIVFADP